MGIEEDRLRNAGGKRRTVRLGNESYTKLGVWKGWIARRKGKEEHMAEILKPFQACDFPYPFKSRPA